MPHEDINILVVDDEEGMRLTLRGILGRKGYSVITAENGANAIEEVKKKKFRVAILDVKMPGMSGVDTFLKIKEIDPEIIVIMMTGYALETELLTAIREGAYAVLYKPLEIPRVLTLINQGLEDRTMVMVVNGKDQDTAKIVKELEDKKYRIVQVDTMKSCLEEIRQQHYQIIIFDAKDNSNSKIQELLKNIHTIQPAVGLVMLADPDMEKEISHAFEDGTFTTLQKPVNPDKLVSAITSCIKEA